MDDKEGSVTTNRILSKYEAESRPNHVVEMSVKDVER